MSALICVEKSIISSAKNMASTGNLGVGELRYCEIRRSCLEDAHIGHGFVNLNSPFPQRRTVTLPTAMDTCIG